MDRNATSESVIDLSSNASCHLSENAAEDDDVARLDEAEAETECVTELFRMPIVLCRIDDRGTMKTSADGQQLASFGGPTICAHGVGV